MVFALILVGCSGVSLTLPTAAPTQEQVSSTATEAPTLAPTIPVTQAPTSTSNAAEMDVTASTEAEHDYCLECHTDQQRLIDTAKPEEEADARVVVYCGSGHRSTIAMTILWSYEFTDVRSMKGGFAAWVEAGFPVKQLAAQ